MSRLERTKVALGWSPVPTPLLEAVRQAPSVKPKRGAPRLEIPASQTIWLRERDDGEYNYERCNPKTLRDGIRVHPDMLVDHFPPRYEHALDHLVEEEEAEDD
jgi:hypothetical protein